VPHFDLPDTRIHYEVFGNGPALLFLSATAWHGGIWTLHQTADLSRDHKVIIFDQRGTGQSQTSSTDFSTERLTKDAVALLDHLDVRQAHICGHSNGGRVAQMLALTYPNRIDRLILASAGATHKTQGIPLAMCLELVEKGYERYFRDHSIETGFTEVFFRENPDVSERILKELIDNLTPLEIFLRYVLGRAQSDTTSRLKDIQAETLVLIGEDETHGSATTHMEFAKIIARDIPNARLVTFPGQGHFYPFAEPDKFNALVRDFLGTRNV
jgi:pimeloyl-ACP methyl ester carboxylesterase